MVQKPTVFISSTSDLRSARDLVAKVLHSMGYEPVWQDVEPTDGGDLLDVLRQWMAPCGLMIQLVGMRYGAEPPADRRPAEFGRVSYTQFEALHFEKLGRKVIYHFLELGFPTDPADREPPEQADLQAAYRARIEKANRLHQAKIASPQDLELSVRRISDELATFRRLADTRYRRMMVLAGGVAAGVALVAALLVGGVYLLRGGQTEQTAKLDQQSVKVERQTAKVEDQAQLLVRIEKLLLAQTQNSVQTEPTLSAADQALLEQARRQGELKTRAGASVLKPDGGTNALLNELQARHDTEAFDLAMLQGKRWYFDEPSQPDKAVPFFERAMELRPDSVDARDYAMRVHARARSGDIAAHRKRAIAIGEGLLHSVPTRSVSWASTQYILGHVWRELPTGDLAEKQAKAVAAYEAALQVYTHEAFPEEWARTQELLGVVWQYILTGDRAENLAKAVAAYEAALRVFTPEAFPNMWAATQHNLGLAWWNMPGGDREGNLAKAVAAYEATLLVHTREAFPVEWAHTQQLLGITWRVIQTGDREGNLAKAVAAFEAALQVRTRDTLPGEWAWTQNDLGLTWGNILTGDRAENLAKAVAAFEAALQVRTRDARPAYWAETNYHLAQAFANLAELSGEDRCARLRQAIACGKAALLIRTPQAFPKEHASSTKRLDFHRKAYEAAGCPEKVPFDDIPPAK
jgi:tetratricopeptide (TPR) repeat protein